ncbi:MAG: hypothetical protein ACR5LF_10345 [Symbiopectobacterium sp.]
MSSGLTRFVPAAGNVGLLCTDVGAAAPVEAASAQVGTDEIIWDTAIACVKRPA